MDRMRDTQRIDDVIADLFVLWRQYPDMRLGQLMSNLQADYQTEDDQLLSNIRAVLDAGDFVVIWPTEGIDSC